MIVAGVVPWFGLTVSQPGGPDATAAAAVKGTGGVLVRGNVWVMGAPPEIFENSRPVFQGPRKGPTPAEVLVKVTSVKPAPNVATMGLVPVVPAGETTLVTVYGNNNGLKTSATVTLVPSGNVVLSMTQ